MWLVIKILIVQGWAVVPGQFRVPGPVPQIPMNGTGTQSHGTVGTGTEEAILKLFPSFYREIKKVNSTLSKRSFDGQSLPAHLKWLFKALFAKLCLTDTELAASRSYRQIKVLILVFRCINKTLPRRFGRGHFVADFYSHLGE